MAQSQCAFWKRFIRESQPVFWPLARVGADHALQRDLSRRASSSSEIKSTATCSGTLIDMLNQPRRAADALLAIGMTHGHRHRPAWICR
jgi:hypothetical protein